MKRIGTALLAICLLTHAGLALAQDRIVLLASEQSSSSRIRIILEGKAWGLEQVSSRQFDLVFPDSDVTFDTTQIFPGRRASRVTSARTVKDEAGTRLRLSLSCECRATMRAADDILTVDFQNLPQRPLDLVITDEEVEPEAALNTPPPTSSPLEFQGGSEFAAKVAQQPPTRPSARSVAPTIDAEQSEVAPESRNDPVPREQIASDDAVNPDEIALAQTRLLEQLTRAAEQGLISFREPEGPVQPKEAPPGGLSKPLGSNLSDRAAPDVEARVEDDSAQTAGTNTPAPDDAPILAPPVELAVRARTAIDRDFVGDRSDTWEEVHACIQDEDLAVGDWAPLEDAARKIAEYRRDLLGEFDQPDPEIVLRLARLYIYLGLGAEAQVVLRSYGQGISETPLLIDMAQILDHEDLDPMGPLAQSGPCSGRGALWHVAGRFDRSGMELTAEIQDAMVDAFAELPVDVRRSIGPGVIQNSIDRGHVPLAFKLDLLLQRVPGDHGPDYALANARLMALEGRVVEAQAVYRKIAETARPEAPEAMILLLESLMDEEQPVPDELTDMISMMAFLQRHGPMGRRLKLAEIRARAGSEGFEPVLKHLADVISRSSGDPGDLRDAGHAVLEESSAAEVGDLIYARAVLAYRDEIATLKAGDAARIQVARQLVDIGLANAARDFLEPALRRRSVPAKMTGAQIALALEEPAEALELLSDMRHREAILLRAEALEKLGEPDAALAVLETLDTDMQDARAALAWQAGDWDGATASGPDQRRILAAFMAGQSAEDALGSPAQPGSEAEAFLEPPAVREELSLGDAQSVMEASETVRNLIEEALNDG